MKKTQITKGFTLIELMIVVGIIGTLAAIAFSAYQDHIIRARLLKAHSILTDGQQLMEKTFSSFRLYACGERSNYYGSGTSGNISANTCPGSFNETYIYTNCQAQSGYIYERDDSDFKVNCGTRNDRQSYILIVEGRKEPFVGLKMRVDQNGNRETYGLPSDWPGASSVSESSPKKCWVTNRNGTC